MNTQKLEGKVAVITGGGRGLGRGVALEMGRAGARLVVADFYNDDGGENAADRVVNELAEIGASAVASYEDVASRSGAEAIIETALSDFGRVDILCTFAGNAILSQILEVTHEDFESSLRVHLYGTFNCIKAALPHMMEQKSGRIITVSSRGAFQGPVPAYSAAKAGVMGLSSAVAMEMAMKGTGVTVNCVLPSAVTQLFPSTGARPLGGMPAPLSSDPEDVSPIVTYLATDGASGINGRFVYASGGDICIYAPPFEVAGANTILRKHGRWTVDEIGPLMEPVVVGVPSSKM